jgi:hypothetical protein
MRVKITPILPKKSLVTSTRAQALIEAELDDAAKEALGYYEKTTRTWSTSVNFYIRKTKFGRSVGTRSRIYTFVDKGTRAHIIRARNAKALAFATGGRPKTRPNVVASYNGAVGRTNVVRQEVKHPGTKARQFTEAINKKMIVSWKRRARVLSKKLATA